MSQEVSVSEAEEPNHDHVVVLVHGIRTYASWQSDVSQAFALKRKKRIKIVPIKYGYYGLLQFVLPQIFSRGVYEHVARHLRTIHAQYPDTQISVICHSFGTYLVTAVIEDNTYLHIKYLILCGAIIPQRFRWDKLGDRVDRIINECGTADPWPVIASSIKKTYGYSGTSGFGSPVEDRFHEGGHSLFFERDFIQKYWTPLFIDGELVKSSKGNQAAKHLPGWIKIFHYINIKYLLSIILVFFAFWVAWVASHRDLGNGAKVPVVDQKIPAITEPKINEDKPPIAVKSQEPAEKTLADVLKTSKFALKWSEGFASFEEPTSIRVDGDAILIEYTVPGLLGRTSGKMTCTVKGKTLEGDYEEGFSSGKCFIEFDDTLKEGSGYYTLLGNRHSIKFIKK